MKISGFALKEVMGGFQRFAYIELLSYKRFIYILNRSSLLCAHQLTFLISHSCEVIQGFMAKSMFSNDFVMKNYKQWCAEAPLPCTKLFRRSNLSVHPVASELHRLFGTELVSFQE